MNLTGSMASLVGPEVTRTLIPLMSFRGSRAGKLFPYYLCGGESSFPFVTACQEAFLWLEYLVTQVLQRLAFSLTAPCSNMNTFMAGKIKHRLFWWPG